MVMISYVHTSSGIITIFLMSGIQVTCRCLHTDKFEQIPFWQQVVYNNIWRTQCTLWVLFTVSSIDWKPSFTANTHLSNFSSLPKAQTIALVVVRTYTARKTCIIFYYFPSYMVPFTLQLELESHHCYSASIFYTVYFCMPPSIYSIITFKDKNKK